MAEPLNVLLNHHPFIRQTIADKIRGLIIGSALGDAIGLYTEFLNKHMCEAAYPQGKFTLTGEITRFVNDSHRNKFFEGSWTDDTDQALLIVLSYLHVDGREVSSLDLAQRLRSWVEQGLRCLDRLPLGLGQTMGRVIVNNTYLDDPKARALQSWVNSSFTAAPNGSLMRTHPLGVICIGKTQTETFDIATDFSLITHADSRCIISCCVATDLLRRILLGQINTEADIDEVIEQAAAYVEGLPPSDPPLVSAPGEGPPKFDRRELYKHTKATTYEELQLDDLRKQGYVYKCLGSALLCLRLAMRRTNPGHHDTAASNSAANPNTAAITTLPNSANATLQSSAAIQLTAHETFETLMTELIMQGGDADTNATVAGALVGAHLGFNRLPAHWYTGIRDITWLMSKTNALIQVSGIHDTTTTATGEQTYIGSQDPDTRHDGGKGFLTKEELEKREMAFMEMYLTKTGHGKAVAAQKQAALTGSGSAGLMKKWKEVFG